MIKEKSKKKNKLKILLPMAGILVLSGIGGFFLGKYAIGPDGKDTDFFMLFLFLYMAFYLQIILHEGGHMIGGLFSGYQFSSFRIGSLVLFRDGQGLHMKHFSLAGTGGQCLMIPPEPVNGMIPVILYNLGGPAMNLITGMIALLLWLFCPMHRSLQNFFMMMAGSGILLGLMNGIPLHMGPIDNDGMNAISVSRNSLANRAFRIQLLIAGQNTMGKRLKDMPEEWFTVPSDADMKNSLVSAIGVFAEGRLLDGQKIPEARNLCEHLLKIESGMVGIHRQALQCDLISEKLLAGESPETVAPLLTSELKQFMKQMKKNPSVLRTRYALAVLREKDPEEAKKIRNQFEKNSRKYPYIGEINSERELMDLADRLS